MPDHAWRHADVQQALSDWDFGTVLRLVRERSGLSQWDVHDLTSLTQSHISSLEHGRKQVGSPATVLALLNGLGLPADLQSLLLTPLTGSQVPSRSLAADITSPWTAERMVTALETAIGGTMKRRTVVALSGAALTQHVLQSAIIPAESMTSSAGATTVTDALITSLQGTTDALRQMDATNGSGNLALTAKTHLQMLLHLLKCGAYTERRGRRLAAVTADTAAQAGWYNLDSGDHDAALNLFLAALRAAHASGDSRLRAGALGFLAIHCYSAGDPRDAITAARAARHAITDQDAPALNAMLYTRQARGHATLREERDALAALARAESLCAQGPGEDDPHWLYWINSGEILGQTGSCYLELGQPAKAAAAFTAARDELRRNETRTTAQFLSRAATAQMRAGDLDAGCVIAHDVLSLADGIHSARLDDHIRAMLDGIRSYAASPQARELLDRGHDILRERAAGI